MPWEVEYTDEFGEWWHALGAGRQDAVAAKVGLLMEHGSDLPHPYSSGSGVHDTGICVRCAYRVAANPYVSSMPLIRDE